MTKLEELLSAQHDINNFLELFVSLAKEAGAVDDDDDDDDELSGSLLDDLAYGDAQVEGLYIRTVYEVGGGEGGGERVERVYEFVLNPEIGKDKYNRPQLVGGTGTPLLYVRSTGYYSSDDGTTWDDEYERVYPHQVITTEYKDAPQDPSTVPYMPK